MKNKIFSHIGFLLITFILLSSCGLYNLEKKLDPIDREWLSIVRYTITDSEKKIFLQLPSPEEREKFRNEFWIKRDPDPDTEENEFKDEYYRRIDFANNTFRGGGRKGFLQDRGRVYILFGPPSQKQRYPGRTPPYEVWLYGSFPITFVDKYYTGDYQLETTNIAILHDIGSALSTIRKGTEKQVGQYEGKRPLDFDAEVVKSEANKAVLSVGIPYKKIWFEEKEGILETTFDLTIEIFNANQEEVWQFEKDYLTSIPEEELENKRDESFTITIPIPLEAGEYSLNLVVNNKTTGEALKRTLQFKISE